MPHRSITPAKATINPIQPERAMRFAQLAEELLLELKYVFP
jgi:hypothetical protein